MRSSLLRRMACGWDVLRAACAGDSAGCLHSGRPGTRAGVDLALKPIEFIYIDDEHGSAADGDLNGHADRFHGMRNAGRWNGDGVAAAGFFPNHIQRGLQAVGLDPDHERRVSAAQESTNAGDAGNADVVLDQRTD